MKTRTEIVNFVEKQMNYLTEVSKEKNKNHVSHYGRMELKELMDFIFGQQPMFVNEQIKRCWGNRCEE